jgi:hypothetical protein
LPFFSSWANILIVGLEENAEVRYGFSYKLINTRHRASRPDVAGKKNVIPKDDDGEGGVAKEKKQADGVISAA